ncbi:MAG: RNA polymerase sigma factor [Bacteroidetes bacterium]|nr:RNA polymerase sigma factor [Bacteroidota bacterium]
MISKDQILYSETIENKESFFKSLVDTYQNKVFQTCYVFLRNKEDAEDISQEVFIEVYNSIEKFRNDSKISTWIYRISINKSLNFLRKQKQNKFIRTFELLFDSKKQNYHNDQKASETANSRLETKELGDLLKKAIETLSTNQKIAFTLNKYDDLNYQQISEVMDISISSVESLLHRAKKKLQKKLLKYRENNF